MTEVEIKKHKMAAERLEAVKNATFKFISKNIGKTSEYDVNKFILSEFKKRGLEPDDDYSAVIVAVDQNAAIPHYLPKKDKSAKIKGNCLVLIDIWAKLNGDNAPFADISWVGYTGKDIPLEIKTAFDRVIGARNFAVKFIQESLRKKRLPDTQEVQSAVTKHFGKMEKYFIHGAGHSLGIQKCHGNYFRFSRKSSAKMKIEIPFTIEPGLYFPGRFGIRSEINCYIDRDYQMRITTKVQKEIIKI